MLTWTVLRVLRHVNLKDFVFSQTYTQVILPKTNFGLSWDDKLILLRNLNGQQMDKKKKSMIKTFKDAFNTDIKK